MSNLSIVEFGSVTVRHCFDFDALVAEARRAGVDTHRNVISRNWAAVPPRATHIVALSVGLGSSFSLESARAALKAQGLRPCTPHETLCIAADHGGRIKDGDYHLALDHIWQAKDGPAVLVLWRSVGRPYVGTCSAETAWTRDEWRLLATISD